MNSNYDVAILGGGLAGLTLALQVKKENPDASILVIERRKSKAKTGAHKVGESTVELGTYYLREVVDLKDYLEKNHLPKYALRYFFTKNDNSKIEDRLEYGVRDAPPVPSHQIDRGIFENDLMDIAREAGIHIVPGKVLDVDLIEEDLHHVSFDQEGETKIVKSKWAVDATGRASLLKRKLNLSKPIGHDINAVWFRVNSKLDMDDWPAPDEWKSFLKKDVRRLGTVHLMGTGYWVWLIPLASGITSVGIVADPRYHEFSEIDTMEKSFNWLKKNEPQFYDILQEKKDLLLDFAKIKSYSCDCKQFFSPDRWGIVGEAGAFLDPFYSPGTDFIAMNNTWTTDLISRDLKGEDIFTRAHVYNIVSTQVFKNWIPVYQDVYSLFGHAQIMILKITWDFVTYWGMPCILFVSNGFINLETLKRIFMSEGGVGIELGKLNSWVQELYLDWAGRENAEVVNEFCDPADLSFIRKLLIGIERKYDSVDEVVQQINDNYVLMKDIAAQQFRVVSARLNDTPDDMPVLFPDMKLNMSKDELVSLSENENAIPVCKDIEIEMRKLWRFTPVEV